MIQIVIHKEDASGNSYSETHYIKDFSSSNYQWNDGRTALQIVDYITGITHIFTIHYFSKVDLIPEGNREFQHPSAMSRD